MSDDKAAGPLETQNPQAEPVEGEGDGGAREHLVQAWNSLAMFVATVEDPAQSEAAMVVLEQVRMLITASGIEDPNAPQEPTSRQPKPKPKPAPTQRASCEWCVRDFATLGSFHTHLKNVHGKK